MSNTEKNYNLNCDIVRDLLPLYHDGVVSEASKNAVEEHLAECEPCKKEYEELQTELQIESSDNNTKNKFKAMMSRQKVKRICILVASIILTCVIALSTMYVLRDIPLVKVPDSEIEVIKSFGYETEDGYEFFIIYNMSMYNSMQFAPGKHENGIQELEVKKPVLSGKTDEKDRSIWNFTYGYPRDSGEPLDYLCFAGETIWSREENANDKIPEYVYDYNSADSGLCEINITEDYIEFIYDDHTHKKWTLDGELIEEVKIYGIQ